MAEQYERTLEAVTPSLSDSARIVTSGNGSRRALFSAIAKLLIEDYEGSTLGGSAQSLQDAIDDATHTYTDPNSDGNIVIT